jgi:hypothetical protein
MVVVGIPIVVPFVMMIVSPHRHWATKAAPAKIAVRIKKRRMSLASALKAGGTSLAFPLYSG